MAGGVTDRDLGFRALVGRLRLSERAKVTVGIHEDEGSEQHEGTELTIVEIGAFHEFGAGVPRRSWLLDGLEQENQKIRKRMKDLAQAVLRNGQRMDPRRALDLLGLDIVQLLQARIRGGIDPPLAPATLVRKTVAGRQGNVPLIDTGQLIQSIRHKVVA